MRSARVRVWIQFSSEGNHLRAKGKEVASFIIFFRAQICRVTVMLSAALKRCCKGSSRKICMMSKSVSMNWVNIIFSFWRNKGILCSIEEVSGVFFSVVVFWWRGREEMEKPFLMSSNLENIYLIWLISHSCSERRWRSSLWCLCLSIYSNKIAIHRFLCGGQKCAACFVSSFIFINGY